jgi:Protein of unknown function (DUF2384)
MTTANILRLTPKQQYPNLAKPVLEDPTELELEIDTKVLAMARQIFKGDEATVEDWLNTPIGALDNIAPIYFLDTKAGIDRVARVLINIAYGVCN